MLSPVCLLSDTSRNSEGCCCTVADELADRSFLTVHVNYYGEMAGLIVELKLRHVSAQLVNSGHCSNVSMFKCTILSSSSRGMLLSLYVTFFYRL